MSKKFFYNIKSRLWLLLVVIAVALLTIDLCGKHIFLIKGKIYWLLLPLVLLFAFYRFFKIDLPKQKIRNQPSWVYYFYWGLLWLFILAISVCFYKEILSLIESSIGTKTVGLLKYFIFFTAQIFLLLLGVLFYKKTKPREFIHNFRFSPDSVGLDQDKFQFEISAKNIAKGIYALDGYVNVVALQGEAGGGKSSYVRMIIESLDKNKILYSYISLTETNEDKDFSKLFSNRWDETLNTRYPKIPTTVYFPLLRSIFRETGNGLLSDLLSFLSRFNRGLIQTKVKVYDKYATEKNRFATSEVANFFGNIPLFIEDFWVIVIDELERSPIIEIYRVIEMIERFKTEGRNGLPIKIIFFLCLGDEMEGLIKLEENKEIRYLVNNFIFKSPKSITQRIFLPPIIKSLKYEFIVSLVLQFKKDNSIAGVPEKNDDFAWGYFDPIKEQLSDLDSFKFTTDILIKESPRVIKRCLSEVQFFYKTFRNLDGIEIKDAIRFSDILLISYIKLKYSNLMTFFAKTCEKLYLQSQGELDPDYLYERLLKDSKKGESEITEVKLLKWVSEIIQVPFEELTKLPIANLVAAVSHSYVDRVNDTDEVESGGISYDGTLSDPPRLMDYLVCVSEFAENKRKKFIDLYRTHQNNQLELIKLSNSDLIEYSRILRDIKKVGIRLNLAVATELYNRIVNRKIELLPNIVQNDSLLNLAVYQFCFQLLEVVEHQRSDKKLADETKSAVNLFKTFLNFKNVDTGSKFVMINSFVNEDRGGGAGIHFRFQGAFETMLKVDQKGITDTIQNTFNEVDNRYLSGNEVIYDKEENFFYVLYQSWSGRKDNKEELDKIHAAAVRGLENNLKVIKLYWDRFPAPPNAQDYDEAVEDDHFFGSETREFNITLKKLIEISDKQPSDVFNTEEKRKIDLWKRIINDKEDADKYYKRCSIKDANDTLASFLMRKGYLQNWPPKNIYDYVKKYESELEENLTIPLIKERLPDNYEVDACIDLRFENNNITGVIVKTKINAPPEHYLHELIHARLFFIENFKTLGHPTNLQDQDKIDQENLIFAAIVDDRIVHQRIYDKGFNPIHDNFFNDMLQQNEYLKNGNLTMALNLFNNKGPKTANLFKTSKFLLAKSIIDFFPKILNEERKRLLTTFINLFSSNFPEAYKISTNIEVIMRKHKIFHKDGHAEILKEIRDYMSINKSEVYLCEYKKINNLYRLEKIE